MLTRRSLEGHAPPFPVGIRLCKQRGALYRLGPELEITSVMPSPCVPSHRHCSSPSSLSSLLLPLLPPPPPPPSLSSSSSSLLLKPSFLLLQWLWLCGPLLGERHSPSLVAGAFSHQHTLTSTHQHTLTNTPSPAHTHQHTPTHPHQHTLTSTHSPAHTHQHTLTNTSSPAHPHQHTLTSTPSPAHPHHHTCIRVPPLHSPTHTLYGLYCIAGYFGGLKVSRIDRLWIFVVARIPRPHPLLASAGGLDANACDRGSRD